MNQQPHASHLKFGIKQISATAVALGALLAMAAGVGASSTAQDTRPSTQSSPPTTSDTDPADAILDRLLGPTVPSTGPSTAPATAPDLSGQFDATSGNGPQAVAPDTKPQRLLREGTFVIDRTGRVRQTDAGDLDFIFTADGSNREAAANPPMRLVANLNLMAIESALRSDPNRRFRITGRVTEYRGRNHLILEKVVLLD